MVGEREREGELCFKWEGIKRWKEGERKEGKEVEKRTEMYCVHGI